MFTDSSAADNDQELIVEMDSNYPSGQDITLEIEEENEEEDDFVFEFQPDFDFDVDEE